MDLTLNIIQVIVALGIYNVWFLRFSKSTAYRGGNAKNLKEEFSVYGLPEWFVYFIGFLKVTLATLLIAGVFVEGITQPAAICLGFLMLCAIIMHYKAHDPSSKSLPAFTMLLLCATISLV